MNRPQLTNDQIDWAIEETRKKLYQRLKQKGYGTFASSHEVLGMATEEYGEFVEAIHNNSYEDMKKEILDLAVGCVFAFACYDAKCMDW